MDVDLQFWPATFGQKEKSGTLSPLRNGPGPDRLLLKRRRRRLRQIFVAAFNVALLLLFFFLVLPLSLPLLILPESIPVLRGGGDPWSLWQKAAETKANGR